MAEDRSAWEMSGQEKTDYLQRQADRVCVLILRSDYPDVDVAIARANLRELAEQLFPDRLSLYDMIYESRFDRLIEQFRSETHDADW